MAKRSKPKRRKALHRSTQHPEDQHREHNGTKFRFLAFEPLSVDLGQRKPISLNIQGIPCALALWPVHAEASVQRARGGTYVALEFLLQDETDMLRAARVGQELLEDFFSAVALIDGVTFRKIEPIQIVRYGNEPRSYEFVYFLALSMFDWQTPISNTTIGQVRGLLAHWDGLDSGARLRRAARQFRKAIGTENDLIAFQNAYVGLEALEKPLAEAVKLTPGSEEVRGSCEKCGAEYTRRRTVLAGVRAYVRGEFHAETATAERKQEWSNINQLRHSLFHSLDKDSELDHLAGKLLPAIMHYLHDAICCLSHAHNLESPGFKIARQAQQPLLVGQFRADELCSLEQWEPLLDVGEVCWVEHSEHGLVPKFNIRNARLQDLEAGACWLNTPLKSATEEDMVQAPMEFTHHYMKNK